MKKKVLSILLAICLVVGMLPATVFAAGENTDEGICPHHTAHTPECGYAPATDGSASCNHTHDGTCGYTVITPGVPCNHVHNLMECYTYNCTHECDDCDGSDQYCPTCGGNYYIHDDTCGYGSGEDFGDNECSHNLGCTVEAGCFQENCPHQHDAAVCGYVAEVGEGCTHTHDESCGGKGTEGSPCTYDCISCKVQKLIEQLPNPVDVTEENKDAVQAQLDAIEEVKGDIAWESLAEDVTVDVQKVLDVQDALDALDESEPPTPPAGSGKDPVGNIDVSDATYYDSGALKSIDTEFDWSAEVNPATSRLVLMTGYLGSNDFSEVGNYGIFADPNFPTFNDALSYDSTSGAFGIITYSNEISLVPGSTDNRLSLSFAEGHIPLDEDRLYYVYLWTYYSNIYYPDHLVCVISVQNGEVKYTPATGRNTYDGSAFQQVEAKKEYSVTVVPGEHMTKTAESGAAEQTGLSGAMTDVVYTAEEGYIFPEDYAVTSVNGITVTRNSETQITVSGTPTDNATITLTAPTEESDEHSHCICGKTHRVVGGHSAESVQTWQPLTITSGTLTSGSYYLEKDVTVTGTITISGTVNLCLNDKSLDGNNTVSTILSVGSGATLNITDCGTTGTITGANSGGYRSGVINADGGNVTLYGGSITNNTATLRGNIYLDSNAVFTMNGGSVQNNSLTGTESYGGAGVYVREATFVMNSGVISGNRSGSTYGGGIYCSSYATVRINGGTITGNTSNTKGNGIFYSSLQGNDGKLYIGGAPNIIDEIYLDNTNSDKYPYITSAIQNQLTLVVASFDEGRVVAEGSGYNLTRMDMTNITLKDADGKTYYCDLSKTNPNQIIMTEKKPYYYDEEMYQVIYDGNGGQGSTQDSAEYNAENPTATIKNSSFTLSGYGFTGWNTKADGTGTAYAPGDEVQITADLILYAQWEAGEYTAAFEVEGGTAPANQVVSYEDKLTKPEDPTVDGKQFKGWLYKFESDADWSTEYWNFDTDVVTENVTLKADFKLEGALEFDYAYDVYRDPDYPIKNQPFMIYNFGKPLGANGSGTVANAGEWVLTPVGLYGDFKNTAAHSYNTSTVVGGAANAYGVAKDSLMVYALSNNDEHYAYGTIVMQDSAKGMVLFIGDNYSGDGAGYLFCDRIIDEQSITFEPESDATDQVGGYTITVENTTNGSASVSQAKAPEGTEITITATADEGYEVATISVKTVAGADVTVTGNKFTMPDSDVAVTVTFKAIDLYTITVKDTTHGTAVASRVSAAEGTTINLTISSDVNYELDTLLVEDADGNEIDVENNQFRMPASNVTVTVTFKRSYIQPVYTVTIPESVEVDFNGLVTTLGKIKVVITKLDPTEWIKVAVDASGELVNEDDDDKVIPYSVKCGNDDFTFATYEQSGETELTIEITQEDWDKAYSGSYSDPITFTISCVNKN